MEIIPINKYGIHIPKTRPNKEKWKGKDLFDIRYWVMAILGKRRSGKSTLIYTLLKDFATKRMIVYFFVPTFWKDDTYRAMRDFLESKGIEFQAYTDIIEDGIDQLKLFMDVQGKPTERDEPEVVVEQPRFIRFNEDEKKKEKKKKDLAPIDYIFILDDISNMMKNASVIKLAKNSRHYRIKMILSTQSITDISPQIYGQLDYLAMFRGFNADSVEKLYERVEPPCNTLEEFMELYETVTESKRGKYNNFLLLDRPNNDFRINLNKKLKF